jgi:hypothetical protein
LAAEAAGARTDESDLPPDQFPASDPDRPARLN